MDGMNYAGNEDGTQGKTPRRLFFEKNSGRLQLKPVSDELKGPCPLSGDGQDRFYVRANGNFHCRHLHDGLCDCEGGNAALYQALQEAVGNQFIPSGRLVP